MNLAIMLAEIKVGGDGFISQLLTLLVLGICVAIIYFMGNYFAKKAPPIALQIWNGLFVLIGGIIIINFLLGLTGHAFLKWD